ncbi:nucleoside, partial [Malassezia pachydermatis]
MSVSRYSFGWYPNKVLALVNAIQQVGWSAVGAITGGLALIAVADGNISVAVGIIIIASAALVIG